MGMMNNNQQTLSEDWKGLERLVLWGIGQVLTKYVDSLMMQFDIAYFVDDKKSGEEYKGRKIVNFSSEKRNICQYKIVVTTSKRVYSEIKEMLEKEGLEEYKDFCHIEFFVTEWFYKFKNQWNVIQLNTAVTTWCTLQCANCNMFMSYYPNKRRRNMTFEDMKADIDVAMKYIDYIYTYVFLGGEPFLNSELKDIIEYIGEIYIGKKVGKMSITTNGTIIPDEMTLNTIKKYNVRIAISDYTKTVDYIGKLKEFISVMKKNQIDYIMNGMDTWKDFGFPVNPFHWEMDGVKEHMKVCSPLFHGINDRKLYYCHIVWSAEQAGLYTVPRQDYIDLEELDSTNEHNKEKVMRYCRGEVERGFLGLCMLCGGCGTDNDRIVKAGIQYKNKGNEKI